MPRKSTRTEVPVLFPKCNSRAVAPQEDGCSLRPPSRVQGLPWWSSG